ncbi:hypothetical protein CPB83DRAFT_861437 [Crepidotus variabilis]|uniref:INO80 complex subunit B-like conserved region domain-containing protein n=1 Tax=Crepidotus variabilis TaxID=179855 RepID=A0A9P6E890_9AGAR|nr:hypothetical protein CPB83DRAFT_861437 [Crepidotus variabilis]
MQMESDEDTEEQIDIEEDLEDEVDADEDGEAEDDADGDADDEPLEVVDEPPRLSNSAQPKLKITLKLPTNAGSSAGTATPEDPEVDFAAFKRTPKRRAKTKVIHDNDIESEDPTSPEESEEEQSTQGGPSRSAATSAGGTRPLTTRQAVLASMVDPTHVSLNEASKSKKQPLNETELALRREETARKRKNLSEKRLEDEKAETINRLLKKQSRPRNKRTNTTELPASGARTPKVKQKSSEDAEDGEGEDDDDEAMDVVEYQEQVKPTMYRWVSSLRDVPPAVEGGEKTVQLLVTFSVPESVYPIPASSPEPASKSTAQEGAGVAGTSEMEVDSVPPPDPELEKIRIARGPGICAVAGCGQPRKYRSVKDWTIGACGSEHLRIVAG